MTQRWALLVAKHTSVTTAHCATNRLDVSPNPRLRGPPRGLGRATTSSRSSQWVPLPRKPTGQEPQDQEPSGKLLHSAPGQQGVDRQPSAGREEMARLAATHRAAPHPGAAPSSMLRDAYSPTAGARRPRGGGPRSHTAHPPARRLHTPTCREAPHSAHPPIGQLFLLHIWCSLTSPTQSLPPCWGSGLLQTRVRSRIPPAQVTVQADHGDQGLHRPSTGGGRTARSRGWDLRWDAAGSPRGNASQTRGSRRLPAPYPLTRAGRALAGLGLAAAPLAVPAPHLWHRRVAEADAGDVADAAGHRAGGPRRPVAPAAVLPD